MYLNSFVIWGCHHVLSITWEIYTSNCSCVSFEHRWLTFTVNTQHYIYNFNIVCTRLTTIYTNVMAKKLIKKRNILFKNNNKNLFVRNKTLQVIILKKKSAIRLFNVHPVKNVITRRGQIESSNETNIE